MGFSAGGHLASTCVTMFGDTFEGETADVIDAVSCRPDFGILCYPVIAMGESYCHQGSVKNLLGPEPAPELLAQCNTAKRVTAETPPIFIMHTAEDKVVPLRNATDFAAACAEKKVPVTAAIFSEGRHGVGMGGSGDSAGWTQRLEDWLLPDLGGCRRVEDLSRIDLNAALHRMLDWNARTLLDRLAPESIRAPTGTRS